MNSNRSFPSILPTEQDASYYYLYGRSQLYRYLPEVTLPQPRPGPDSNYTLFTQRATGQGEEGPQTVEQLITRGYFAVPAADAETALISDKRATAWLGLDDLVGQVQGRIEIYRQNFYEIEQAKCHAINDLFAWESQYSWPASSDQQYRLTKRLQELYADQRAERISLWRDVSRIRQILPETVQSYLSAHRKMEILDDDPGDAP